MTEIDKNEDVVKVDLAPSASEQLRLAREEKKLTIAEVAAQLRLPKDTINYLETGQWDKLHGRAYARGYFSNYVNFLGLPQDTLLAAFNNQYKASESTTTTLQQTTKKKGSPLLLLLLITTVSLVAWFGYQQWQYFSDETTSRTESLPTNNQDLEPIDRFSSSVVEPLSEEIISTDNEQQLDAEEIIFELLAEAVEEEVNSLEEEIHDQEKKEVTIVEQQSNIEMQNEIVVDDVVAMNVVIEMQFSGESWVEVIDADGQVLINKIVNADKKVVLSGRPPLNVSLGRALAVEIKYDNEVIDTAPYTQGDVAKFSLGAAL